MNEITSTKFFETEYIDFSVYDNVRKIASYLDGLKNAQRKVMYTMLETNCDNFTKVSNLGPRIQDFAQYLHGSLENGVVNMTQDYVASGNNIPYLVGDGNFGTRFIPNAAASRYIFAKTNPIVKDLFKKEDNVNLYHQVFEGDKIEPLFYMPIIPTILANQQEGMSIGFAQKILPRDPNELAKWVKQKAEGKRLTAKLTPYWSGQDFTVEQGETELQWVITGSFKRVSRTKLQVTSLPVGYNLKQYHSVLDKLVDDKVIRDYDDLSDDDKFCFDIIAASSFTQQDDDKIIHKLKLQKRITENFTCVDDQNKIVQFKNAKELLEKWYNWRIVFNEKRKEHLIDKTTKELQNANTVKWFIEGVVSGEIVIQNKTEKQIMDSVEKLRAPFIPDLLKLPMRRLTSEEIKKLKTKIDGLNNYLKELEAMTFTQITIDDLKELKL